jgi:hypothetical protein
MYYKSQSSSLCNILNCPLTLTTWKTSFENVRKYKCLGTTLTNRDEVQDQGFCSDGNSSCGLLGRYGIPTQTPQLEINKVHNEIRRRINSEKTAIIPSTFQTSENQDT